MSSADGNSLQRHADARSGVRISARLRSSATTARRTNHVHMEGSVYGREPWAVRRDPAEVCDQGLATPDSAAAPGSVSDCAILLRAQSTLAGTATLDWDASRPLASW